VELLLKNKQIVLGITGGIAAYKSAELVRRLRDEGAKVRVVMTDHAKQFITPLTLQAISGHPVHDDLFDVQAEAAMGHIELARWADLVLIAPASADCLAKLAHGHANNLLTTLCLATEAPVTLAPAMNGVMWKNTATQQNVQALQARGIMICGPGEGAQACGETGAGRMLEPHEIIAQIIPCFGTSRLNGKRILMTAGPTREAIDPVRYLTNASSGKMGYALAEAAQEAGATVTLISGPVHLSKPTRVECIDVISAQDMFNQVMNHISQSDIFISVAAVADYRCQTVATQKISKIEEIMNLTLERTPDILSHVTQLPHKPFIIGFAAETENVLVNARTKLQKKKLDMLIANQVGEANTGFDSDENQVIILWQDQEITLPNMSKTKLARALVTFISERVPA